MSARMDQSGRIAADIADTSMAMSEIAATSVGLDVEDEPAVSVVAFTGDLDAMGIDGESGTVTVDDGGAILRLNKTFFDPVVFTQVVSKNESDPVIAAANVVTGFSGTQVTLTLHEHSNDDGIHGDESVHVVVVERGIHGLNDGRVMLVDRYEDAGAASYLNEGEAQVELDSESLGVLFSSQAEDAEFSVIARTQGATGWNATRASIYGDNNAVARLDLRIDADARIQTTGIGYMIIGTTLPGATLDTSVAELFGSSGNTGDNLFVEAGTYGSSRINASHSLVAGVSQTDGNMWAGGKADITATLFSKFVRILALEASASENDGTFSSLAYLEVVDVVLVDEPIGVNYDWSTSQEFFSASASYFGVTVSGEVVGTLGIEASAAVAGSGVTISGMPYVDVTASASAGVGGWCLSAGVGADLSLLSVSVPTEATLVSSNDDIAYRIEPPRVFRRP